MPDFAQPPPASITQTRHAAPTPPPRQHAQFVPRTIAAVDLIAPFLYAMFRFLPPSRIMPCRAKQARQPR